jgi:16S rRNA (guanine966-N2)-methyltransferase
MKDRTRQAVFNLLGPAVKDKHAIDLFAGTGALGLEALSRGAERATLIERHLPTAKVIRQNVSSLRLEDRADVLVTDAFFWVTEASSAGKSPWLVFCSPPYQFYVERLDDMQRLIENLIAAAPVNSYVVVEADERFNMQQLPLADKWKVRRYSPAMIAILGPIGACE